MHTKGKRIAADVDLARRRPGHARHVAAPTCPTSSTRPRSFAVREGADEVHARHFEHARDRVLMGARRDSMALSDREKELTAYHEAGHAVCAAVLPHADPLHKVTILPMGMALGVTQQLPAEDRHSYDQDYLEDSARASPWAAAWPRSIVFGVMSTGGQQRPRQPPPSWPARWSASGACPTASARWPGARRARCSSARTSCTPATTPTTPPG